jgi:hypothetical protein
LKELSGREKDFSAEKLRGLMDSFASPLQAHLGGEIQTLLSMAEFQTSENDLGNRFKALCDEEGKKSMQNAVQTIVVPFSLYNHDREFEDGLWKAWPPIPGPMLWIMTRVLGWWHRDWWKFASCNADGVPRELFASN